MDSVQSTANTYMARQAQNVQSAVQMNMLSKAMNQNADAVTQLMAGMAQTVQAAQSPQDMYFSMTGVGGGFDAQA